MGRYTVAMTGASGSVYGMRLIEQLLVAGHEVAVIMTESAREVAADELSFELPDGDPEAAAVALATFLELPSAERLRVVRPEDRSDPIGRGPHQTDGMIVAPASMGLCSAVASGSVRDLVERAAEVCLKERRTLILMPREMPLSTIHLRNMLIAAEAGAVIMPAMPAFCRRPGSVDELVSSVVGKVLDLLGSPHSLYDD